MENSASLQNLNDIVAPGAVPWWPLAPGWYLVAAIAAVAILVFALQSWRKWRNNRYRRQALLELREIRGKSECSLQRLPSVLKRTALSAWPRESVAALSGEPWHRFLDDSASMDTFSQGAGDLLDRLAYGNGLSEPEQNQLLDAAEHWVIHHRLAKAGKSS